MFTLPYFTIQYYIEDPTQCDKARMRRKVSGLEQKSALERLPTIRTN